MGTTEKIALFIRNGGVRGSKDAKSLALDLLVELFCIAEERHWGEEAKVQMYEMVIAGLLIKDEDVK